MLHDIIASGRVPVIRLQRIYRQAGGSSIVENAHKILGGSLPSRPDADAELSDFYALHVEEPGRILDVVENLVTRRIPQRFGLDPRADIQVLVPMHRGVLGAENLNRRLQARLNPDGAAVEGLPGLRVGDRVIQTRNDYEREVANGDVGTVLGPGAEEGSIRVRFDAREVIFPREASDHLRLAYALTIHKSQGSEYPAVVIPLHTQHYVMLRRNLLYTAVTRGKALVVLVGSPRAIRIAVQRNDAVSRNTLLAPLLAGSFS